MSSGYINRIHFTPSGANWNETDPNDCYLNAGGLDFKFIGEEYPEADYIGWVSPTVNAMGQVVLRTVWWNTDDIPDLGFADYILTFGTFSEENPDPIGSGTWDYMLVTVDLSVITGDFPQEVIDIDVSHFFGGDISHATVVMERVPLGGPGDETNRLSLRSIRTLTPAEIAVAPDILPWVPMPPL